MHILNEVCNFIDVYCFPPLDHLPCHLKPMKYSLILDVSRCQIQIISDINTIPTHIITLNYVTLSYFYRCQRVNVGVLCPCLCLVV